MERSHRTNDEEFYIPGVLQIKSKKDLLNEARGYIYYYNHVREHSSLDQMPYIPYQYPKMELPEIDDNIRYVPPIILDDVSVKLGLWSGDNVLAHHPALKMVESGSFVDIRESMLGLSAPLTFS